MSFANRLNERNDDKLFHRTGSDTQKEPQSESTGCGCWCGRILTTFISACSRFGSAVARALCCASDNATPDTSGESVSPGERVRGFTSPAGGCHSSMRGATSIATPPTALPKSATLTQTVAARVQPSTARPTRTSSHTPTSSHTNVSTQASPQTRHASSTPGGTNNDTQRTPNNATASQSGKQTSSNASARANRTNNRDSSTFTTQELRAIRFALTQCKADQKNIAWYKRKINDSLIDHFKVDSNNSTTSFSLEQKEYLQKALNHSINNVSSAPDGLKEALGKIS